jgi:uncharacterized protein YdeI (YjbR/CyaY-like superfamily)
MRDNRLTLDTYCFGYKKIYHLFLRHLFHDLLVMSEDNPTYFISLENWRDWLKDRHEEEQAIWIILQKKASKKLGIRYEEAVLEAVAHGWIDGKMKRLNDEEFMQRFTPRRRNSLWSLSNRKRAERLISEGRMTQAGLKAVKEAKQNKRWDNAYSSKGEVLTPYDLLETLSDNQVALDNFNAFPPSARFMYIHWINEAKRTDTRKRRIITLVERAEKNLRPGIDLRISKTAKK